MGRLGGAAQWSLEVGGGVLGYYLYQERGQYQREQPGTASHVYYWQCMSGHGGRIQPAKGWALG